MATRTQGEAGPRTLWQWGKCHHLFAFQFPHHYNKVAAISPLQACVGDHVQWSSWHNSWAVNKQLIKAGYDDCCYHYFRQEHLKMKLTALYDSELPVASKRNFSGFPGVPVKSPHLLRQELVCDEKIAFAFTSPGSILLPPLPRGISSVSAWLLGSPRVT